MAIVDKIKGELKMGLKLVAYKSVNLTISPMAIVDEAMKEDHWNAVSELTAGASANEQSRFYYSSAVKTYVKVTFSGYTGACAIESVDESDVLESLNFEELKKLGNILDKKSVAFIRIYSERELESAKTEEELNALNERNARMIQEAEEALRKR